MSARNGRWALAGDAATAAVVLSTDADRVAWVSTLLQHFGCRIYPLKSYFNQEAGHEEVELVVLDPNCLTQQQLQKMTASRRPGGGARSGTAARSAASRSL